MNRYGYSVGDPIMVISRDCPEDPPVGHVPWLSEARVLADCPPREVLRQKGWVPDETHDINGDGWWHEKHRALVEIDQGDAYFYGFEACNDVTGLDPATLRAFAALAEETAP